MVRTAARARVFNGEKHVIVKGFKQPFQTGVALFNFGRLWWLHYGYNRNTGAFKTKRAAREWWLRGGR